MINSRNKIYRDEMKDWDKLLKFYDDEIGVFESRLEEVVTKNTGSGLLGEAEHFQNQFILQKEQFDLLQHDINEQKTKTEASILQGNKPGHTPSSEEQHLLRNKIHSAEKIFVETKHGFYRFLSKVF